MILLWAGFLVLVLALLALDLGVFHRRAHADSVGEALGWSGFWIALGLAFSGVIYLVYEHHWLGAQLVTPAGPAGGGRALLLYLTGYLLEKSLSVDNLFVIALVFTSFRVRVEHQHRVLFWGIVGALVFRGLMIAGGVMLVRRFTWVFYIFGAYLLYAGARILLDRGGERDPRHHPALRLARRLLPISSQPHEGRFTLRENGRRMFTELIVVLLVIELTDVVFAVDSVPAVLAITTEPFIVVTSNVFAILGLRALYFVLAGMMGQFHYLKVSLALLLGYIGAKLMLFQVVHIPAWISLTVIVGLVGGGVLASLWRRPHRT